jgi:hypothetical protein
MCTAYVMVGVRFELSDFSFGLLGVVLVSGFTSCVTSVGITRAAGFLLATLLLTGGYSC